MAATNEKSEYFESLREEDKKGYLAKLTLSTGEHLPDPFILHSNWSDDVSLLSDITYPDIYHYLIEYGYLSLSNRIPKSVQQRIFESL